MAETGLTKKAKLTRGLFFPFGIKLALIVTLILLGSIWTITTLMALMVSSEFARTADNSNFDINVRAAAGIRERLYKIRSEALYLLDLDTALGSNSLQAQQIRTMFFERNPNIAAIFINDETYPQDIINQTFFTNNEVSSDDLKTWLAGSSDVIKQAQDGVPVIKNVSPVLGINLLALFYPWQADGLQQSFTVFFSPENLAEISGTGSSTTFVVNGDGDILIHPDFSKVLEGGNIGGSPLAAALAKAPGDSVRLDYTEGGSRFVGAGNRIPFADTAVYSTIGYSIITEQITGVTRRNIYLSVTVLFLAILVTWFFSKTITNPLKRLSAAAAQIEAGEFDLNLKTGSRDEFGALTGQFNRMGQGLIKWTDAKKLVGRYTGDDLFSRAMQGKLNLSGEYGKAIVLSVEFITFAEISQNLEAGQSLELLNSFLQKITEQVQKDHGLTDKINGSRLIAYWNIPNDAQAGEQCMECLHTVITLRSAFWEINTEREGKNLPLYRMGCGIQVGDILAGRIGTSLDYQYAIAGRTVDDAIRAAEACVPSELDIILNGAAKNLAGPLIICEDIEVKKRKSHKKKTDTAQEKPELRLFGLVNMTPQGLEKPRWPFNLNDVRESLVSRRQIPKAEEPDTPAE
ncbi:MAG: HAMP domain-containing protein [Treponema sp.]|nr:HAMP domain-containing protein [Treponema sp.]